MYREWDVLEHAEPRRQERDGSLRDGPRRYRRNKLLLLVSVAPIRETSDTSSRDDSHGDFDERVNVDAFIHQPMAG